MLAYARRLFAVEQAHSPPLRSLNLNDFAIQIALLANEATQGLYPEDRVFVAAFHRFLVAKGKAQGLSLMELKRRLAKAHRAGWLTLSTCQKAHAVSPMLLDASAIHYGKRTFHLLDRSTRDGIHYAISDLICALPPLSRGSVTSYATQVVEQERLRGDRPRLGALSTQRFANRVQEIVNRHEEPLAIQEAYRILEEYGETTGLGLEAFHARIDVCVRAGLLRQQENRLEPSDSPLPIPWGRPKPPIRRPPPPFS